jgi:hypothetical protein
MGCDIHTYVERQNADGEWERIEGEPFDVRSYGMFGFLANVRNYSEVPTIALPRGLPSDASDYVTSEWQYWLSDGHTPSWLTVEELSAFDYDAEFEDLRVTRGGNGGCTAEPGGGEMTTFREFLGPSFFDDLTVLQAAAAEGPVRVVFWFDC